MIDDTLVKAAATLPASAGPRRRAQPAGAQTDFSTQVAAFYPYPPSAEPGNRAQPERPRNAAIAASSGIGRRREPREG